jgi:arsenate reductase (glutaredoxin)
MENKLLVFGIPNCDTVKKTLDWLKINALAYDFHDYKKLGISESQLQKWLTQHTHDLLINRKGTTWRALNDDQKAAIITNEAAIALMIEKPSVIKRPVVMQNDKIVAIGFDANVFSQIFL